MYNRYVPSGSSYTRVAMEDGPGTDESQKTAPAPHPPTSRPRQGGQDQPGGNNSSNRQNYTRADGTSQGQGGASGNFFSGAGVLEGLKLGKLGELFDRDKSGGISGLLGALGLEEMDSGDILLLLIVLFLLAEGDNLDLVITLGLMLLLGLNDKKEKNPDSASPSGSWDLAQGEE